MILKGIFHPGINEHNGTTQVALYFLDDPAAFWSSHSIVRLGRCSSELEEGDGMVNSTEEENFGVKSCSLLCPGETEVIAQLQ